METMLVFVTLISAAIALGAAFLVWQMRNREKERQRARVAALAQAIHGPALSLLPPAVPGTDASGPESHDGAAADLDEPATVFTPAPALFDGARANASVSRRGPALAFSAAAAVVAVTGALVLWSPNAPAPKVSAPSAPLELLSLQQQQDGVRTVISGLVRNPSAGQPVRHLTAVVLLYDRAGAFVASSRAPLDYTTLKPGEESPFTVSLQDASPSAARYRLSFRLDESGVVPHVDRREKSS